MIVRSEPSACTSGREGFLAEALRLRIRLGRADDVSAPRVFRAGNAVGHPPSGAMTGVREHVDVPETSGKRHRRSVLLIASADHRFENMTVNQRGRWPDVATVRIVACHPKSFPEDVRAGATVHGLPISRNVRPGSLRMAVFSLEVAIWAVLQRGARRRLLSFQDTSAVAGLIVRSRQTGWVVDAVDDPAMELSTARRREKRVKAAFLSARDRGFGD